MVDDIAIQEFVNALKGTPTDSNTTYSAKVSRVDKDGTVWVNLFGSEKETPTASASSEVKRGDSVNVSWRNNKLYVDGNYSNPSSGVESTKRVEGVANDAKQTADIAYEAANNAVADAERARVAAESAEADALSAAQSSASAGESASRAQAASEAAQLAALSSITTDTIHYLATDLDSGITTADPPAGHGSWSTTIQTMTATNKYLWTYHTYTTAGGATRDTTPALTGTYGEKGADGTSVTILGSYNTLAELEQAHPTGTRGDAYMVSGDLYVWNGSAWENVGQIQGPQGPQGAQGNSVTVSSIAYAVTSTESEPQSYPYSTVPTVPEGSWLWTKTTYSDGNVAITKSKQGVSGTNGTNGRDGRDGIDGTNGTNGISVSAVQPQYYLSTSSAEATGGSWSTSLTYVIGKFIWTRDYITYSDNSHGTSSAIYNQALTESCYNAAEALGLISEQQQYFYHDSLGAHVLSSPDTTGVRYRTDIEGAGLEINELSGSTEKSVAAFGANGTRIGLEDESYVQIDYHSLQLKDKEGNTYFHVSDLRDRDDSYKATFKEYFTGNGTRTAFKVSNKVTDTVSVVDGNDAENTATLSPIYEKAMTFDASKDYYRLISTRVDNPTEDDFDTYYSRTVYSEFPNVSCYSPASPPFSSNNTYFVVTAYAIESPVEEDLFRYYTAVPRIYTFTNAPADEAEITITYKSDVVVAKAYTLGRRMQNGGIGVYSVVEGESNIASGRGTHVEGIFNKGAGQYSHAEGMSNSVDGWYSHVEGNRNIASAHACHAEGYITKALNQASHAEGRYTKAMGYASHAEGDGSHAMGYASHAEGVSAASGDYSHSGGYNTSATGEAQTVIGRWNKSDTTSAFIIGNGDSTNSSNAFKVDWNGDIYPQNTKMADFVVEQGTDGIWNYRKWNSGIAECWGNYAVTLTHYTQMFGGYAYNTSVAFPSGLFLERPNVTYSAYIQNALALTGTVTTNSTKDTAYVYAVSSTSGSKATNWYIKAVGKWK